MGGPGSTRWSLHTKKMTVEDSRRIKIYDFKKYLTPGKSGSVRWWRGQRETASIGFVVSGSNQPESLILDYTYTSRQTGEKTDLIYPVWLTTTQTAWGAIRYWFVCPLIKNNHACSRRVGALYLPPGAHYFGCRHCYDLTYESCQESGKFDSFWARLAESMQDSMPGITGKDVRYILENRGRPPEGGYFARKYRRLYQKNLEDLKNRPDPYAHYLTESELLEQSGLSEQSLRDLESVRLLLPDRDGKYRPKLVGWARKLAYMIDEGWELEGIKRWSKERFSAGNPKEWPPIRVNHQ